MIPIIKIEIEQMRHQIAHHLGTVHQEIEEAVDKQLKAFIEQYDFEREVRNVMDSVLRECIRKSLENHFMYGDGRKAIDEELKKIFKK